ncbi:uncharacterized protein PEZ65_005403 [Lycodopsis pacificus]
MMETKVWIALCALLLVHCGSNVPTAVLENKSTSQPSLPLCPTSHTPTTPSTPTTSTPTTSITSTSITSTSTTTTAGPTHTTHTTPTADTPTTTPQTETTHHAARPDSATPSNQPTHNTTLSPTSAPTTEPPKPETTAITITTASSISSTSSSQEGPGSDASTLTPPQNTSQSDGHAKASSEAQPTHAVSPPSSPSAQAKTHADPSQLNVGDDPTMVHDSPTLDPLLAGLVSAFIITAVIITLLLFLKLRRRDNRPEFRRLQDLPMDDMMEDTPLSMYSY